MTRLEDLVDSMIIAALDDNDNTLQEIALNWELPVWCEIDAIVSDVGIQGIVLYDTEDDQKIWL